jgi:acetolactate synthase-1/2/3 large subunit
MNGAESLLNSLCQNGVEVCFANPGTSEMHFVAALERVEGMRCVLGLFEGVVTGAADGYARMLDKPACTLLHLGPGLANGLSNLHNALRAQSPVVNIIGDHATYHRHLDAPLTSDIEGAARPFSHWVRTSPNADSLAADAAAAVAAAKSPPGRVASLILPADAAWNPVSKRPKDASRAWAVGSPVKPSEASLEAAATMLKSGAATAIILGGRATREAPLELAGKIAAATGARLLAQTLTSRITRGAGRVEVERIPYPVDQAVALLKDFENLILMGAKAPVGFFAYPNKPSVLYQPGTRVLELAPVEGDVLYGLQALSEAAGAQKVSPVMARFELPARPSGAITPEKIGLLIAATLPEGAIVVDESITTGRTFLEATHTANPHDWILPTGGSIGYGLPVAIGAAIACPDRKVLALESDGSGLYMPQALWTHARESLNILTLIFANRKYQILRHEMQNVGASALGSKVSPLGSKVSPLGSKVSPLGSKVSPLGPKVASLLDIGDPDINWVGLAKGFGVEAYRAQTMDELSHYMDIGYRVQGPFLIEVVL